MFHSVLIVLIKCKQRLKGLYLFLVDYKVISFSLFYIFFDILFWDILRNNEEINFGKLLIICVGGILLLLLVWIVVKKVSHKAVRKKGLNRVCCIILSFLKLLIFAAIVGTLCYIRCYSLAENERNLSSTASSFTDENAQFDAKLTSEVTLKHTYNTIEVRLMNPLTLGSKILPAKGHVILIKIKKYQNMRIGEVCTFRGTFKVPENFEDFAYQDYLRNNDIYLTMEFPDIKCTGQRQGLDLQNKLVDFKNSLNGIIAENLKEPHSSLLMGIIFGQNRLFSENFDQNIRIAGVSHIVAASGYNITILIMAGNILFKLLPQKPRILILIIIIWGFCILSGLSPSILRACIMATISLLALFLGKKSSIHIALPLASCIFIIIAPKIIFNVGFQLSVSATTGLIYLHPTLAYISEKICKKKILFLTDTILPTLSCTLVTIPVTIYTFNTISIWSVIANILILPVIESTMFLGILGIGFSKISFLMSRFFFEVVNVQLKYFELVVNTIESTHTGAWELNNISIVIPIIISTILIILCLYFYPIRDESYNYYIKASA